MKPLEKTDIKRIVPRVAAPIVLTPDQIAAIAAGMPRSLGSLQTNTQTATTGLYPRGPVIKR